MLGRHLQSISRHMIASMLMLLLLAAAASCFAEVMVHNSAATLLCLHDSRVACCAT